MPFDREMILPIQTPTTPLSMANHPSSKHLKVYGASAGSGKTHQLTGFYLQLLFRDDWAPQEAEGYPARASFFSEILAVTFTNKATEEMKSRIVSELKRLAENPLESPFYEAINPVADTTGQGAQKEGERRWQQEQIQEKARSILSTILNDYSNFNVSTIDSFFQKVLRAFARELDVQGNFEIELDPKPILEAAVNAFVEENKGDSDDDKWLRKFSEERLQKGGSWDFKKELLAAAEWIDNEEYKVHKEKIARIDSKALLDYAKRIKEIKNAWEADLTRLASQAIEILEQWKNAGIEVKNFSHGWPQILYKWKEGEIEEYKKTFYDCTFLPSSEVPAGWFSKTAYKQNRAIIDQLSHVSDFQQALQDIVTLFDPKGRYKEYHSALLIGDCINRIGVISAIEQKVRQYCKEEGIMMLSSTTELLNRIIRCQEDAPFVYEKVGSKIRHLLIDEFQDTSVMQWSNFQPLLVESIGQGFQNLIVGDIKQSIYRWRGGEWSLLDSLYSSDSSQSKEGKLLLDATIRHERESMKLDTNRRSHEAIVHFNNAFFSWWVSDLSKNLPTDSTDTASVYQKIYCDVCQKLPEKKAPEKQEKDKVKEEKAKEKFVKVVNVASPDAKKAANEENIATYIPELIKEIEDSGYEAKEIAIIARNNSMCQAVVNALLKAPNPDSKYNFATISGEALSLADRPEIKAIVNVLRYLQNPQSKIAQAIAQISMTALGESKGPNSPVQAAIHRYAAAEDGFKEMELWKHLPLYEMVETIISHLPSAQVADKATNPFLQAFRDSVLEFVASKSSDLTAFLEWWDTSGIKKTIESPADQNAIKVMTIHKAKGLGEKVVIVPFAEWKLADTTRNISWCDMSQQAEPFCMENLVLPISMEKKAADSIFFNEYRQEKERVIIDNLNIVYVAFTRAKERLYIVGPQATSKGETDTLAKRIQGFYNAQEGTISEEPALPATVENDAYPWLSERERLIEAGLLSPLKDVELPTLEETSDISTASEEDAPTQIPDDTPVENIRPSEKILSHRLSRHHNDDRARRRGIMIHDAFASVQDASDISTPISRLYSRGIIDPSEFSREEMIEKISDLILHSGEQVAAWFAPGQDIYNEQEIIGGDLPSRRPDRIIIQGGRATIVDYKTGTPHRSYKKQVKGYMDLLRQMGYHTVEGYIWYIGEEWDEETDRIQKV